MATSIIVALIGAAATAGSTAYSAQAASKRQKKAEQEAKKQNVLAATQANLELAGSSAGDEQAALQSIMNKIGQIS